MPFIIKLSIQCAVFSSFKNPKIHTFFWVFQVYAMQCAQQQQQQQQSTILTVVGGRCVSLSSSPSLHIVSIVIVITRYHHSISLSIHICLSKMPPNTFFVGFLLHIFLAPLRCDKRNTRKTCNWTIFSPQFNFS